MIVRRVIRTSEMKSVHLLCMLYISLTQNILNVNKHAIDRDQKDVRERYHWA